MIGKNMKFAEIPPKISPLATRAKKIGGGKMGPEEGREIKLIIRKIYSPEF